jgi:predicted phosphodiesterase
MPKRSGDEITQIARRLARENPDHPARGLARMLVKECNGALTLHQARMRIQRQLGVHGKQNRKQCDHIGRAPRQAGVEYRLPPSMAESWEPHKFMVVGLVGVISDIHIPYHDEVAVRAAVSHLKDAGLDGLVINGDLADFYAISRFTKDPRQRDFSGELEACRDFIGWLRDQFPKIPIIYAAGNHEERWQHYIWQHAPELSKDKMMCLQQWLHLDKHDITLVEQQRPILLGKLPVLHGHQLARGFAAPVNPARGAFMKTHSTCLVGHHHQTSVHASSNLWHDETTCWSVGCLSYLSPEYSRVNNYNHGCATVRVHKNGEFDVTNMRISNGTVRSS